MVLAIVLEISQGLLLNFGRFFDENNQKKLYFLNLYFDILEYDGLSPWLKMFRVCALGLWQAPRAKKPGGFGHRIGYISGLLLNFGSFFKEIFDNFISIYPIF